MKPQTKLLSKPWSRKLLDSGLVRSWWIFVFAGLCVLFYFQGIQKKQADYTQLTDRMDELELQKIATLQHREDLLLQINSQSDPAWIQLTLMKGLGVVPEGQMKVYFKKED